MEADAHRYQPHEDLILPRIANFGIDELQHIFRPSVLPEDEASATRASRCADATLREPLDQGLHDQKTCTSVRLRVYCSPARVVRVHSDWIGSPESWTREWRVSEKL